MSAAAQNTAEALVERMRTGDVRALARAVSLVENDSPLAASLLSACLPYAGSALRIGITGAPGAGKSTLVDRLARRYREQGLSVGVVAVDPTSPYTGGALLGDRIRMKEDLGDTGLYVRSMATRGALGGVARTTADVMQVIAASGRDVVLVETVGVGQDEVDIARLADLTLVVLVPGMGDDVQSIKAGIMEIADIFVLNKSDRDGVDRLEHEVRAMQGLATVAAQRTPPIVRTVASTGQGIDALAAAIDEGRRWLAAEDRLLQRRRRSWRERIAEMVRHELLREARSQGLGEAELELLATQAASGLADPYTAVPRMVRQALSRAGQETL